MQKSTTRKLNEYWNNADDGDRKRLMHVMRYQLGLTVNDIAWLLEMTQGQAKYAHWKYR